MIRTRQGGVAFMRDPLTLPRGSSRPASPAVANAAPPLILHVFPTFSVGGAQVRLAALANRFGDRWQHGVVGLDGRFDCALRVGRHVRMVTVGPPWGDRPNPATRLHRIVSMLRKTRPALLVTSNWGSMEWAVANRFLGLPHLHTEDGFGPEESAGQFRRRILARRLALRGSTVVLPSSTLLRVATDLWRLPPPNLRYVPNGLDLQRFRPDGPREPWTIPGEGPVLGIVAALRAEKNVARLLHAAALLRADGTPLRLVIVGEGPERPGLEALAHDLDLSGSTLFAGHVPDPAAAYRAMDIACLSSDTEQMPFSVLEAMATALPIASTDVGDVATMVAPDNRPHVVPRDAAALAGALRPLLRDAALRHRLGHANRSRAERHYDEETMFAAHAALLDGLIRR